MICGNTCNFIGHPTPKDFISAHGASYHAWAPYHLNPALLPRFNVASVCSYCGHGNRTHTFTLRIFQRWRDLFFKFKCDPKILF